MIDSYIEWNLGDKVGENKKMNNIMNISTCIGIPPFSFNYNGGKLICMLMFSKEVYDYVIQKYGEKNKIVGLSTYSLHGKSIQYDRLKELKYLGLIDGYGASHVNNKFYNILSQYMKLNNIGNNKIFKSRMFKIKYLCNHLGIRDITFHGIHRGIYFGYLGTNGKNFLNSKTNDFEPNMTKTINDIYNFWKNRWAINRFINLIENNQLMVNYEFQSYTNDKEYNKWRINKYLKQKQTIEINKEDGNKNNDINIEKINDIDNDKNIIVDADLNIKNVKNIGKKYVILSDDDKRNVIKIWYENKEKSFSSIEKLVTKELNKKVDRRTIYNLVTF